MSQSLVVRDEREGSPSFSLAECLLLPADLSVCSGVPAALGSYAEVNF